MQKKFDRNPNLIYTKPMSETAQLIKESLSSLELVEAKWEEMINQTVANSGQFQQECEQMFDGLGL